MIAVIARSVATNNTGFEPGSSDYVLYKNSRFKECYNLSPGAYNCTQSHNIREDYIARGFGYVRDTRDWCQIASCFHGFKIIPSAARLSATKLPDIACWWTILLTSTTALWHTGRQLAGLAHNKGKSCKGSRDISWIDWICLAYDICGPVLWWWVSFAMFATDPAKSATIAVTSWVTTWKLGRLIQYHPYYCALPGGRRTRRTLPWILNTMALLQWIAGVYVLYVYRGDLVGKVSALQSYDCLASRIRDAPGSTLCTPEELCSKSVFFQTGAFYYDPNFPLSNGRFTLFFFFLLWTLTAVLPFILVFIIGRFSDIIGSCFGIPPRENKKDDWKMFNLTPNTLLSLASLVSLFIAMFYSTWLLRTWDKYGREGPVTFHRECNALHVHLSPWRSYFDLSGYARVFRIVKMWFNA
ncbi:hypothetical protein PRK78_000974 [Emydomyces testavorans]|uniref:Uncharacterized protein n=1 Tax=Emydomyces testavorans TaxID=2070801 RepID=A0AAF0IGC8_9EURO|nr:hypothetical protein PRK78_000974 [Emydomyces testavorans]